ncbi:MAG TPA: tetratricopeptide repeat protein, partial [Caldilineaceae bacterium]|nr:tetratricopeptide repeat protein [Caldilineaceae bacterium]
MQGAIAPDKRLAKSWQPMRLLLIACLLLGGALTLPRWPATQREGRTAIEPGLRRMRALPLAEAIAQAQARLRLNRDDSAAYAQLGLLLLQQVRLTGDAAGYLRAGAALDEALARDPNQLDALMGKGILALALHDFEGARAWAEQARAINPFRAELLGILVDAHVELGQYAEAKRLAKEMVSLRPGLSAYTRISYLRELHGDVRGAIEAMEAAVQVGAAGEEP